jgi:hypothetical protein
MGLAHFPERGESALPVDLNLLIYGRWDEGPSKFKATVLVAAFPTRAEFGRRRRRIESVTADAVEGRLTAFPLKLSVVAPVIPEPDAAEYDCDNHAVDHGSGGQVEHGRKVEAPGLCSQGSSNLNPAKRPKKRADHPVGALRLRVIIWRA